MTTYSSYKPFLIGQGKNETGLFQYYESWITPDDAFVNIQDAYVNRGNIVKRDGQTLLGNLTYCNSQILAYGNGTANLRSGIFSSNTPSGGHLPIIAGTVVVRTIVTGGVRPNEIYTDNGIGQLLGDQGGVGTIVYTTGAWTIDPALVIPLGSPMMIDYAFVNKTASNVNVNEYYSQLATNIAGPFTGTQTKNLPITAGSAYVVVDVTGTGYTAYLDDGLGNLRVSLPAGAIVGSVNYSTGAWTFTIPAGTAVANSIISFGYAGPTTSMTIMGINQWENETNGTSRLTIEDERRFSVLNANGDTFDAICDVNETLFIIPDLLTFQYTNFTAQTATTKQQDPTFIYITPLSIVLTLVNNVDGVTQDTQYDNGEGVLIASTIFDTGSINYITGQFIVNLKNPATFTAGWAINVTFTLQNDYFTGGQSDFFNWTNWEKNTNLVPITPGQAEFQFGFLYLTNNVDPITLYNGTTLSRPAFAIQQAVLGLGKNQIKRALDVKVFAKRLLFFRPTDTIGNGSPSAQDIYWSALLQPTNTVQDIPGSGGDLPLSTYGWIQSAKFLKDFIIINCQRDTFTLRDTGSAFDPFKAYKLNSTKTCDAPYGSIEFDDFVTSMGNKGLCRTDGVALERYDEKVFDQFHSINQDNFQQCFGYRFDILDQSWMLYPKMQNSSTTSDQVLVWNYREDSWSVYNMELSVIYATSLDESQDLGWQDFAIGTEEWPLGLTWEDADISWNDYLVQKKSQVLIGGDFLGNVVLLNRGPNDLGAEINMNLTTKKYNPFIAELGTKCNFGYLDVYYTVNSAVTLTFQFFPDNATTDDYPLDGLIRTVILSGQQNQNFSWQRIYLNIQSQFLSWQITDNGETGFKILGQLLWASPAGRLTP